MQKDQNLDNWQAQITNDHFEGYILKNKKSTGSKIAVKIFTILKISLFIIGVFSAILFFFNFISILIGGIFFFFLKGIWRLNGFMLALAAALAANAPPRSFVEITGIYPLLLVIYIVLGILGIYFFLLAVYTRLLRVESFRLFFNELTARMTTFFKKRKLLKTSPVLLMLLPVALWASVNIDPVVIFDNKPQMLWVNAPTTVQAGKLFELHVQSWDQFERVSALYKGTVTFCIESYGYETQEQIKEVLVSLPEEYTFTGSNRPSGMAYMLDDGKDNGRKTFQMRIDTPGIHYIRVTDSLTGNTYYSNPVWVDSHETKVYWGDIHTHGIYSDGSGTPDHLFYYARYVAMLDFYALTEHGEIIPMGRNWFNRYVEKSNLYNVPGKFVTLLGMEYTNHKTGHFACLFSGDSLPDDPLISFLTAKTPFDLWEILDDFTAKTGHRALAIPHHTVKERYMQDWTYYNPRYVKIAEVTNTHGDSLYEPSHPLSYRGSTVPPPPGTAGCSITDALKMGLHLSLNASSDSHDGHPGHSLSHTRAVIGHQRPFTYWWTRSDKPYPGGLTAIQTDNYSREGVFRALENRQIYANSDHGRPLLLFTINGESVGGDSTVRVDSLNAPRELKITIAQDGSPSSRRSTPASVTDNWQPNWNAKVEILKNGDLLTSIPVNRPFAAVSYTDEATVTGTEYNIKNYVVIDGLYYINEYSNNPVDPSELHTGGKDFYIIRIVGENGRHSFIGPIWIAVFP